MSSSYNDILIDSLKDISSWDNLKLRLEKYNTSKTRLTRKKTTAGKIFEYFAKYYLQSEPEQIDLYDKVWLYDDIPLEISRKLKLPSVDHGIDILIEDKDSKYHAVQCKFKNDETLKLSWSGDKIANVFALGTLCDSIIVFTNTTDVTKVAQNFDSKYSQIAYDSLISIKPDVFENILRLANEQKPKELIKFQPKDHQKKAIQKVTSHFHSNERGQLILPCGAGKTLTALWIKENLKCKNTLVLLPSLALLKQIKNDWARHKNAQYKYICVCSEKDIDKDRADTVIVHTYEIGGLVTTDPEIVSKFLKRDEPKVVFSTYQSLRVLQDACTINKGFSFCFTICDEAHRTAGSKNKNVYTLVHDNQKIPSDKRLYMTATPKVIATSLKNKLGDEYELLCDMSNPKIFGEEAFRMTFGEAIDKGILVDYKIIGIGVTDKQVKGFIENRNYIGSISVDELAHNFALDLVMNKYNAFHALSFHSRVHLAKEFSDRNKIFFRETFAEYVEGKQTTTYRAKVLHNFKNSPKAIVSNARCLTEGVDVPTIDLIYFCDPKTSKIDIVQASGRALRTDKNAKKEMGYIVVPMFHHIDEDIETEIKRKPIFNYLIQVVRSLCDQDERLQAEIDAIAFQKGKRESSRIEIELPDSETEKIIKFEGLENKLKTVLFDEIIEKNKDNWEIMFMRLKEFLAEHGHMNVSRNDDKQLQNWIYERRRSNREGRIDPKQKRRLNEIGFDWKSEQLRKITDFDEIWWNNYEKLIDFFKEKGHSEVPTRYKKDKSLGIWVVAQGQQRRENRLSQDRIDLLNELNFNWNRNAKIFEDFCERLVAFKTKYNHADVPTISKDFPKLGRWTNKYRLILNKGVLQSDGSIKHKMGSLSKSQIDKLNKLGFKRSVRITDWMYSFNLLKEFYDANGHSKISEKDSQHAYYWAYRIRKNPNKVTLKQKKLLESIEFEYLIKGDNRYLALEHFFKKYKNFEITAVNEPQEGLYRWLILQRRLFYRKKLSKSSLNKFESIGFDFKRDFLKKTNYKSKLIAPEKQIIRKIDNWKKMLGVLKEYYNNHGSYDVPKKYPENQELSNWIYYQKTLKRTNKLEEDKIIELEDIGFVFPKPLENKKSWDERFEELLEYKAKNGDCQVPVRFKVNQQLATWVRTQRRYFKEGTIEADKKQKLEKIGFIWRVNN